MYSYGSDTSTWNNPNAYKYDDAAKPYLEENAKEAKAKNVESTAYKSIKQPNLKLVDPRGKYLTTDCKRPIIFGMDLTESTKTWHAEIIDRLALLAQTVQTYDPTSEISFSAVTDTFPNLWPLQVGDFAKGVALDEIVKGIYPEGKGGPGMKESYELWGHFMNTHLSAPKAKRPLIFLVADEMFYEQIDPEQVSKYIGDGLQEPIDSMQMWHELTQKVDLYILHKTYPGIPVKPNELKQYGTNDEKALAQWRKVVGHQNILPIDDGTRVIDVTMAIIAKHWGKESDFVKNLDARQDDAGKSIVYNSLRAADIIMDPKSQKKLPAAKSMKLLED